MERGAANCGRISEAQSVRPRDGAWFHSEHRRRHQLRLGRQAAPGLRLPHFSETLCAIHTRDGSKAEIIKASEHGLGLYYRPKEGRDPSCDVPLWIKEGWQWILNRALGLPCEDPDWFGGPVMRRIAISTPNVMAALRRLNRDQARPYNFALSPVLVNLSNSSITLLGRFEKDPSRWATMPYVNIHDGSTHTLKPPTLPVLAQTFGVAFA